MVTRLDGQIVLALHGWAASSPVLAFLVTIIAEDGPFLLPIFLGVLWFWRSRDRSTNRRAVLAGGISVGVALVLMVLLGFLIDRPRPFVELGFIPLFPHGSDSSFPSDHTLIGEALVGPLLWLRPRVGIGPALWALLVGFARVAAGIHFPSDILLSVLLASGPSAVGLLVARLLGWRPAYP
jgi:undecaprenyl-diphosphatase